MTAFRVRHKKPEKRNPVDGIFLLIVAILVVFGLLMVYEASVIYSFNVFGDKYHYAKLQLAWVLIGFTGMFLLSRVKLDLLRKYSFWIFLGAVFFLLFLFLPLPFAPTVYGAKRWIILNPSPFPAIPLIGRIGFQPSELAKLASIIFFASFLSSDRLKENGPLKVSLKFAAILGAVFLFVAAEPDFTTAFVLALILIGMYFVSNIAPFYYFLAGVPILGIATIAYAFSADYRKDRIQTLINPENSDVSGAGYHIRQVMIALGSGGFFGLGLGQSRQKYAYLPEVTADSIFAVVGEEFGFVGTTLLVSIFILLIWRGLVIAQRADNKFSMLLVSGVILWIAVQMVINLGSMVRLLPITGIPLPLISYGGSSAVFIMWGLGLVLNVSRGIKK